MSLTTLRPSAMWRSVAAIAIAVMCAATTTTADSSALVEAVKGRNLAVLKALVKQRVDVNAVDPDGASALLWAAHGGDREAVDLLLAAGAKADLANAYGVTPLYEASARGDAGIVEKLLKAGANPNTVVSGETALMAAAETDSLLTVRLLRAHGADLDAREIAFGQTALMRSLDHDQAAMAKVLIEMGANVDAPSWPSPLPQMTEARGSSQYVGHPTGGFTPLMFAARQGNLAATQALLAAGASRSIDYLNPDGIGALMLTVLNANWDLTAVLLEKGASPNEGSLYQAIDMHNLSIIETLGDSSRPMLLPTSNKLGALDVVGLLLKHGADPNAIYSKTLFIEGTRPQPPIRDLPLLRALRAKDTAVIRLLLQRGADPNLGATRFDPAEKRRAAPIAPGTPPLIVALQPDRELKFAGGGLLEEPEDKIYRFSSQRELLPALQLVLDAGADINAVDPQAHDATILHAAAQRGDDALVRFVLERGAKLYAKDRQGLTALDYAQGKVPAAGGRRPARPAPVHKTTAALLSERMCLSPDSESPIGTGAVCEK